MPTPSIGSLLTNLTREPGRPRITWYGPDSERVELSGAVLENWVNKTTNLLVEEFDAGPGTRVLLDLPGHWRTVVWALAVWRVGAAVALADPEGPVGPVDLVVTDRPAAYGGEQVVAVALPALARRFGGALPPGAIDAAPAVMGQGDAIGWTPPVDPDGEAVSHGALRCVHRYLVPVASAGGARVLLAADDTRSPRELLQAVLAVLADNGSLVLVAGATAAALTRDETRRERLLSSERITEARWTTG